MVYKPIIFIHSYLMVCIWTVKDAWYKIKIWDALMSQKQSVQPKYCYHSRSNLGGRVMNNKYYNKFYWISKQIESTSCGFILAIVESNEWVINHVLQVGVIMATYVSSHLKVFHEIGLLENFKKFTEKQMYHRLFSIKLL